MSIREEHWEERNGPPTEDDRSMQCRVLPAGGPSERNSPWNEMWRPCATANDFQSFQRTLTNSQQQMIWFMLRGRLCFLFFEFFKNAFNRLLRVVWCKCSFAVIPRRPRRDQFFLVFCCVSVSPEGCANCSRRKEECWMCFTCICPWRWPIRTTLTWNIPWCFVDHITLSLDTPFLSISTITRAGE